MNLAQEELTVENVRNLSAVLGGSNEVPLLFDRTTLVNASVVYSVPQVPTLSTWMMIALALMLFSFALIYRKRLIR
ncbi:MAG: IPTL-CTERM sorting domain-containing protein [Thermodesulfobacteriota bacterium]